jgi:hypothetical protein
MNLRKSSSNSTTTSWSILNQPTSTPTSTNETRPVRSTGSSTVRIQPAFRLSPNFTMETTTISRPRAYSTTVSSTLQSPSPTTVQTPSAIPAQGASSLSPSTAMGIGVAAGIIGVIVTLTAALFVYRCWKVRRSPAVQYYEKARLWKGFTPATPSTARTTLIESKMANIYFTEIRSPGTPSFTLTPPMDERGTGWPLTPATPKTTFGRLSV